MSGIGFPGLDSSVLLGYYQTQLTSSPTAVAARNAIGGQTSASQAKSATANDAPPWQNPQTSTSAHTATVLSTTNFLDTSNVPLSPGATSDAKLEQDNQKLFSLYSAFSNLAYLTKLAQGSTETSGQLAGLNARFQAGMAQAQAYLTSTNFNNYALQAATPAATTSSTANISFGGFTYSTRQLVTNANLDNPIPGLSASSSFTIAVKKGATTTNVAIDLSQVQGALTLGNVVGYINSQLAADGFSTRFQKTQKGGTTTSNTGATYGLQITPGGNETISLSASATPSLYMVGNSGTASETNTTTAGKAGATNTTTTPADQTGRLVKLSTNSGTPSAVFTSNQSATTGTTTAADTVVDASGNVYVVGNATGNFGSQLNQGSQDAYLTKYDSAGNVVWQKLLGSAGSANGYGLALDPSGGVVVTGSSTADLTTASVADGNEDSFVAKYDTQGNQTWIKQIQTLANNKSNTVSVDASGNIYIGGSVSGFPVTVDGKDTTLPGGVIGAHQTAQGGADAYLAKFDSKGKLLSENQFGTSGNDQVSATATGTDGSLYVASVQNGEAIVSKYANGDITSAPAWSQDLGALAAGGAIGGLAVSGGKVYVSGTTTNGNLTAGGQAGIATASTGGTDAFVFAMTDNGASVSADHVSYIGTSASEQGRAVTVGPDGTVYLTGSTMGTFAGQQRNIQKVSNAFATALNSDGSVQWTQQYGGADGQSTGASLAVDPQGSSVLDALGLPRGTISLNQSVDLTAMTTLRAGDSFKIKIDGIAPRTTTITIDPGETINSLSTKINAQLGAIGKAAANYTGSAEGLKLTVNPGHTIELIAGPADLDALGRLGISPGVLTAPATASKSTSSSIASNAPNGKVQKTYGLGLSGTLDISTKTGADLARSQLLGVLSNIQSAYQKSNAPPPSTTTVGNTSGTASASTMAQLANYNLALSFLGNDPNNAVANIQSIVSGGGGGNNSLSSLLSQLGG